MSVDPVLFLQELADADATGQVDFSGMHFALAHLTFNKEKSETFSLYVDPLQREVWWLDEEQCLKLSTAFADELFATEPFRSLAEKTSQEAEAAAALAPIQLELEPATARQGEILVARVLNTQPKDQYTLYLPHIKQTVPIFQHADEAVGEAVGLVQLNITAAPGLYTLELREGENCIATADYTVVAAAFSRQDLETTASTQAVYSNKNLQSDQNKVALAYASSASSALWQGTFVRPVVGRISTQFGQMRYVNGKLQSRHTGLDLAAPENTEVRAAASGKVVFAEALIVNGNTVILDHGLNVFSTYSHLNEIRVQAGVVVKQGDILGLVGSTGYSTGPHLHYTVKVNDYYVSPEFMEQIDLLSNKN